MKIRYRPKEFEGKFRPGDKVTLNFASILDGSSIVFKLLPDPGMSVAEVYDHYNDHLYDNGVVMGGIYEVAGSASYGKDPQLRNRFITLKDDRYTRGVKYPDDLFVKVDEYGGIYTSTTTSTTTSMPFYTGPGSKYSPPTPDPGEYSMFTDPDYIYAGWFKKLFLRTIWYVYKIVTTIMEWVRKLGNWFKWVFHKPKRLNIKRRK